MIYVRSFKLGNPSGVRLAHCSDCLMFHRNNDPNHFYLGYCQHHGRDANCNNIPCGEFKYKFDWLKPKDNVKQLNLFEDAKSIQDVPGVRQENASCGV